MNLSLFLFLIPFFFMSLSTSVLRKICLLYLSVFLLFCLLSVWYIWSIPIQEYSKRKRYGDLKLYATIRVIVKNDTFLLGQRMD